MRIVPERESARLLRELIQSKIDDMETCTLSQHHIHKRDYGRLLELEKALRKEWFIHEPT